MKKSRAVFSILLTVGILIYCQAVVYAHEGDPLDAQWGHWNKWTRTYHYHTNGGRVFPPPSSAPTPSPTPTPTPMYKQSPVPSQKIMPSQITVKVNGESVAFEQKLEFKKGEIIVPVRPVVEKLGCTVEWDSKQETLYINKNTKADKSVKKGDNINICVENEVLVFPDRQPENIDGVITAPILQIVEKLNADMDWDGTSQTVYITLKLK